MKRSASLFIAVALALASPGVAQAAEIFGGIYVHDVDTPLSIAGIEDGAALQVGLRGGRIGSTPLQPYIFGSVSTAGETHYAAAGISATFGSRVYVRPGVGLAVHSGSTDEFQRTDRIAFGSRILFEPELAVGARINDRLSLEASWVHLSHARLFSRQNPGMDSFGIRANLRL